jgi:Fibronectin type III domain
VAVAALLAFTGLQVAAGAAPNGAPSTPRKALAGPANGSALLSWAAPARHGTTAISGYAVRVYENGAVTRTVAFASNHTHRTVTGLTNGAKYSFAIAARNQAGQGPWSAQSLPIVVGAPTRPLRPAASAGNAQATVSWKTPASGNGAPITGYVVVAYKRYTPIKTWSFPGTATRHVVDGLVNGQHYHFNVRAQNARGLGPPSLSPTNAIIPGAIGDGPPESGGYFSLKPPGAALPSEQTCAQEVHRSTWEPRPDNTTANHTKPKNPRALAHFSQWSPAWNNNYKPRITGNFEGTTDEIIQWAACKWGWSDNLIRAEAIVESSWHQSNVGDGNTSYGLMQVRYLYHPRVNGGCKACAGSSWPNSEKSTAFDVDLFAAEMRGCYNGMSTYLGDTKGDVYGCIASWYSGAWSAGGHTWYADSVRSYLSQKPWLGWSG